MADDARQPSPDLTPPAGTQRDGEAELSTAFDLFELLRRMEGGGRSFGQAGGPGLEPARLGQHVRLGYATEDVPGYEAGAYGRPARVTVASIGLLGPEGPMPLHLTRWVLDRLSQRWFAGADARQTSDTTFVDFVNMLQHRMIALFYRAWADQTPAVQVERRGGGRVEAMLAALAGIGLPGTRNDGAAELNRVKLRQAAALASQVDGPERLTLFVAEAFGVPVRLEEFVAAWIRVPRALQTRLGRTHAALGAGASIGPRTFTRQARVELRIGPLGIADYLAFLPATRRLETLKRSIRDLVGDGVDVDVRLVLARQDVPPPTLGTAQLGRTAWLARPGESADAEDLLLRAVVGWRPDPAEVDA